MSETASRAETTGKSRTARQDSPSSADYRSPPFAIPEMEIPEAVRDVATNWVDQGKKAFEEMNGAFESAYSTAARGAMECGVKITEATRVNTAAAFDLARALMAVKSLPEMIEITTTSSRKQFDTLASQNQELWTLTQQLATETIKPLAGRLPKVFGPSVSS